MVRKKDGPGEGESQCLGIKGPWKFHGQDYSGCLHHEVLKVATHICNFCLSLCIIFFPESCRHVI